MQFLSHNFYKNFNAGMQSGDTSLTGTMLVNEVSNFIVLDTKLYVDTLNKIGIKCSENDTDETLADKTIKGLKTNAQLPIALAWLIADANGTINNGKVSKAEAEPIIKNINVGIADIGAKLNIDKVADKEFKTDLMHQIEHKAGEQKDYKRTVYNKKVSKLVKFLGFVVVVGLVGWGIQSYRKKKLGSAINVAPTIPLAPIATPTITPIVPAPAIIPATPVA